VKASLSKTRDYWCATEEVEKVKIVAKWALVAATLHGGMLSAADFD
jgi:hypothetical protein